MNALAGKRVCVVGAGWGGCTAAVLAARQGAQVTLLEASRHLGGRARRVDHGDAVLDNGQHILIGAYAATRAFMASLGLNESELFVRIPMQMRRPNGDGFAVNARWSKWPRLATGLAVLSAKGWTLADKFSLGRVAAGWELKQFTCAAHLSVSEVCAGLTPRVMQDLIEPLCVSALNTPASKASASVFLRVLRDAMFLEPGGSDFLLPKADLSALLPLPASQALVALRGQVCLGQRALGIEQVGAQWRVIAQSSDGGVAHEADAVIVAAAPADAARLINPINADWADTVSSLQHEAITSVYARVPKATGNVLASPVLALQSSSSEPAQFVFDRGQLGGTKGLLAFVVSASEGDAQHLGDACLRQGRVHLGLAELAHVQTIVEKRATFACTPGLKRAPTGIAPGLVAVGDHLDGPYPATLEGTVRSAVQAVEHLTRLS